MGDVNDSVSGVARLFCIASEQMGYFTAAQAAVLGVTRRQLHHHAQRGTIRRIRRGLYRLRDYPSGPYEETMAAWLALGKENSVVSHESALELLGLSDVVPDAVHLTVPRRRRHLPDLPGVIIHTTTRPPGPRDTTTREGIRITSAARTILDAAQYGTGPEQIEMAIRQAFDRALLVPEDLIIRSQPYDHRVRDLIARTIGEAVA